MEINENVKCTTNTLSGAVLFEGKCVLKWEGEFVAEFGENTPLKSNDNNTIEHLDPDFQINPDKHYLIFKEGTNDCYYVNPKYTEEMDEDDGSGMDDVTPISPEDIPENSVLCW